MGIKRNIGIITFGNVLTSSFAILNGIILSRCLTMVDYGTYRQVFLIFSILQSILLLGIPQSLNYFMPTFDRESQKTFLFQAVIITVIIGLAVSLIMFLNASLFAKQFNNSQLFYILRLYAIIPIFVLPVTFFRNFFIVINKHLRSAFYSVSFSVLKLMIVFVIAFITQDLKKIIYGLIVFNICQFFIIMSEYYQPYRDLRPNFDFSIIKKMFAYSIPIWLAGIVGIITKEIDKIVISSAFSPSQYAIYANGAMQIPFISAITGGVIAVIMPEMVKLYHDHNIDRMMSIWHEMISKVAILFFLIMCLGLLFSKEIMICLYGINYSKSAYPFSVYLLMLPMFITTFGLILLTTGNTKIIFRLQLCMTVANIVINILFLKILGFIGPAVATVILVYIFNLLQLKKSADILKIEFHKIFPWNVLKKLFLISLIAFSGAYLIKHTIELYILKYITSGVILIVSYTAMVHFYGIMKLDNIKIKNLLKREFYLASNHHS
ncbi:MAG: oligosaccharide flippase family protein [Candidatus Hodarchaeota archaeon]